jgi:hypothetical protein
MPAKSAPDCPKADAENAASSACSIRSVSAAYWAAYVRVRGTGAMLAEVDVWT